MLSGAYTKNGLMLHWIRFGEGDNILLTFHGFGRSAKDFLFFQEELKSVYTVYSFDFFHHGDSVYPENRVEKNTLTPEELNDFFNGFLLEEKIDLFSLMGYSMGGKIALQLLQGFDNRIERIFLMAPDGISTNFWYKFTSKNRLGMYLYRKILNNPKPFFRVLKIIRKLRFISDKLYRFVLGNLDSFEKREQVYKVWLTLRHIDPPVKKSVALIKKNNIPVHLLFGKYDQVITPKTGKWMAKKTGQENNLHFIGCGHNLFVAETKTKLKEILTSVSR